MKRVTTWVYDGNAGESAEIKAAKKAVSGAGRVQGEVCHEAC